MIKLLHVDCMDFMATLPDKAFSLAICDPPYGIGAGGQKFANGNTRFPKDFYRNECWDIKPDSDYWSELFRVSENQIVFGMNYFLEYLPPKRGFIVWDKTIYGNTYADCELAWNSIDSSARIFRMNICQITLDGRIHPTQKPVKLYEWLLTNYAKPGDRILDTHGGSMSIAIACHNLGYDLTLCELDADYYNAGVDRFNRHTAQARMFTEPEERAELKQQSIIAG